MDLKKFLKTLKLNEETISMVLGGLVIIIVGILVVNYFKDKRGQTLPESLSTGTQTQTQTQPQVGKTHTVTKGETLWSIAETAYGSGYNWVDLYSANKLKSEQIDVGQKLEIPAATVKQPTVTKSVAPITKNTNPTPTPSSAVSGNTYTVLHGDTLWSLSVRAYGDGYKWVNIAKANNLHNPNVIHAGNVIKLPR